MNRRTRWLGLSALALLAILAGGWTLLIGPERSEAADLRLQAESEQLTNAQLETQLEVLRRKAEELPAKRAELADIAEKVPQGPSLPDLVRLITAAARDAGVVLTSVTPSAPVPVVAEAPAAPAAPAEGTAAPAAPAAPAEGTAAPVPPAPTTATATSGLSALPVVLDVDGDFYELEQFLALLEDLPRAVRITSLVVQADDGTAGQGATLHSTVTASAYLTAAPAAPATPAAPTAPAAPAAPAVDGSTGATEPATSVQPSTPSTGTAR